MIGESVFGCLFQVLLVFFDGCDGYARLVYKLDVSFGEDLPIERKERQIIGIGFGIKPRTFQILVRHTSCRANVQRSGSLKGMPCIFFHEQGVLRFYLVVSVQALDSQKMFTACCLG